MHQRARFVPLVIIVLAIVGGTWWWATSIRVRDGALTASGTIEVIEVAISPEQGGRVVSVPVAAGDTVQAGQVLVRLDTELLAAQLAQARANLSLAQANYDLLAAGASEQELAAAAANLAAAKSNPELVLARQAYDDLYEQADLISASAQSAVARAEERLEDARNDLNYVLSPDIEYYQEQVDDAREALLIAQQNRELTSISELIGTVDRAQENFDDFADILRQVQDQIDNCVTDPDGDGVEDHNCDPNRAITIDRVPWTLADAQEAYNDAQHALRQAKIRLEQAQIGDTNTIENAEEWLNDAQQDLAWALRGPKAIDLALAQADVAVAEAAVADARTQWEAVRDGPDPDALAVAESRLAFAEANLAAAQAQVDLVEAGPRAEQLAAAQAQVEAAQATVELLELRSARQTLTAPVDGVVLSRNIEPGETTLPGATLLTIGQLDDLTITVYVPEDRYGAIALGQEATLTVDSFPDEAFSATVERIADKAEFTPRNVQTAEGRATTVFAVELSIDGGEGRLKPGMPADVDFGK